MRWKLAVLGLALLLVPAAAPAAEEAKVTVTELLSATQTSIGQPLVLPAKDAQVIFSEFVIAPGAVLPVHKHPFPRYAYVLEGELRVSRPGHDEAFDYRAGEVVIEMVDEWHYGTNIGDTPLRLLVIDQIEAGSPVTVLKE